MAKKHKNVRKFYFSSIFRFLIFHDNLIFHFLLIAEKQFKRCLFNDEKNLNLLNEKQKKSFRKRLFPYIGRWGKWGKTFQVIFKYANVVFLSFFSFSFNSFIILLKSFTKLDDCFLIINVFVLGMKMERKVFLLVAFERNFLLAYVVGVFEEFLLKFLVEKADQFVEENLKGFFRMLQGMGWGYHTTLCLELFRNLLIRGGGQKS